MKTVLIVFLLILVSAALCAQGGMGASGTTAAVKDTVSPATGDIRFPNAFLWNKNGPTGGYWSEGLADNTTFRPVCSNIVMYWLRIYTRSGELIYESRDIKKGWDGYLNNGDLALQGVYVWKVTGKYSDGAVFSKIGDVTFLH